jgi:hypothetical protein
MPDETCPRHDPDNAGTSFRDRARRPNGAIRWAGKTAAAAVTVLLLLGAVGCEGSEGSSDVITIEGSYALEAIDGSGLPAPMGGDPEREVVSGEIVLREDATCERLTESRPIGEDDGEITSEVENCLWAGNPEQLEIIWSDDRIYLGSLVGGRLTLAGDEAVFVYVR